MTDTPVAKADQPKVSVNSKADEPTAVKAPHSARSQMGRLSPAPEEGILEMPDGGVE